MLLAILFCILKNNASGYPATVTAVDIIDTMYLCIDLFISVRCFKSAGRKSKDVHRHKIIGGTGNTAQILH